MQFGYSKVLDYGELSLNNIFIFIFTYMQALDQFIKRSLKIIISIILTCSHEYWVLLYTIVFYRDLIFISIVIKTQVFQM